MSMDGVHRGWVDVYTDRLNRANEAKSPELKAHFEAELKVIRVTMDAMDIKDGSLETPLPSPSPSPLPTPTHVPPSSPPTIVPTDNIPPPDPHVVKVFSTKRPEGKLPDEEANQLGQQVIDQLMKDLSLTREQAAGVVGNLIHESAGMNPHVNEFVYSGYPEGDPRNFGPPANNLYGYGWAQWTADRKEKFLSWSSNQGLDPGSPAANYGFLVSELRSSESKALESLKQTTTVEEATFVFRKDYERAANPIDDKRVTAANAVYSDTNLDK